MSPKVSYSPIILYLLLVLLAPYLFWYANIEHPSGHIVLGEQLQPVFEYDKLSVIIYTALMLLMFIGGARGLYKAVERQGAVAPPKITLASICGSLALLGARLLSNSRPESVLARFDQGQSFKYVVFIFIFSIATIVLLAIANREQRRIKSTTAGE